MDINLPAGIAVILAAMMACGSDDLQPQQEVMAVPDKLIEVVLSDHTPELMEVPGVVGTARGECDGDPCILVLVIEATAELADRIPDEIDGYRVVVNATGPIRALNTQ